MKYVLDTNICIDLIRQQSPHIYRHLSSKRIEDVGVSAITVAELQVGVAKSNNRQRNAELLEQFLSPLVVADFDASAASLYGEIRAYLEIKGTPIGSMDMLIAAHALSLEAILVTNNLKEFRRVPDLEIEDWTK